MKITQTNNEHIEENLKFISLKKFSCEVEQFVNKTKSNDYIGIILKLAEKYSIDLEEINKFISKPLLQKLEYQCNEARLLKDSTGFNSIKIA